jgi:predicted alpha/beta-hydrolase family hydrolase
MNLGARVKGFHACIAHLEETEDDKNRVVFGGRSMGARGAVVAASEAIKSSKPSPSSVNLVLVSYPLQGPKDVRDQILLDLPADVSVLFISGDRDSMCPLKLLRGVIKKMKAQTWLVVVEGLDHGMHGKGERVLGEQSGQVAAEWVAGQRGEKERVLKKDG